MNERLLIAAVFRALIPANAKDALALADDLIEAEKKTRAIPQPLPASASATEPPRH